MDDVARHASTAERRLETLKQETEVPVMAAEWLNGWMAASRATCNILRYAKEVHSIGRERERG